MKVPKLYKRFEVVNGRLCGPYSRCCYRNSKGEWLKPSNAVGFVSKKLTGNLVMCRYGMHAGQKKWFVAQDDSISNYLNRCFHLVDTGAVLYEVKLTGGLIKDDNGKWVGRQFKILRQIRPSKKKEKR